MVVVMMMPGDGHCCHRTTSLADRLAEKKRCFSRRGGSGTCPSLEVGFGYLDRCLFKGAENGSRDFDCSGSSRLRSSLTASMIWAAFSGVMGIFRPSSSMVLPATVEATSMSRSVP